MHNERVRHIMTEAVLSIGVREPVSEVLRLFASYPMHHLPVVDGLELVGMLSSADMLKLEHFVPKAGINASAALVPERFSIATMMRQPVITAALDDTLADAASRMAAHGVHALPVVDESRHLLGIVTTTDVMYALLHSAGHPPGMDPHTAQRDSAKPEMRRAIEAARLAVQLGTDQSGVATSMLYLHERNAQLEELRKNVARYLRGGQDERLHSRLIKDLDRLDEPTELPMRL